MAPGSSWSRFLPVTPCAVTRDRLHRHGDERPATVTNAPLADIHVPLLGRQFLTGGSGCDGGELGAGIEERT